MSIWAQCLNCYHKIACMPRTWKYPCTAFALASWLLCRPPWMCLHGFLCRQTLVFPSLLELMWRAMLEAQQDLKRWGGLHNRVYSGPSSQSQTWRLWRSAWECCPSCKWPVYYKRWYELSLEIEIRERMLEQVCNISILLSQFSFCLFSVYIYFFPLWAEFICSTLFFQDLIEVDHNWENSSYLNAWAAYKQLYLSCTHVFLSSGMIQSPWKSMVFLFVCFCTNPSGSRYLVVVGYCKLSVLPCAMKVSCAIWHVRPRNCSFLYSTRT